MSKLLNDQKFDEFRDLAFINLNGNFMLYNGFKLDQIDILIPSIN